MIKITFVDAEGQAHVREAQFGYSLMEIAVKTGVPSILGECGGNCACGTCRVYIDDASWRARLGTRSELEQAMIDYHDDRDPHARLSCQIKLCEQLDGLVVRLPRAQR